MGFTVMFDVVLITQPNTAQRFSRHVKQI